MESEDLHPSVRFNQHAQHQCLVLPWRFDRNYPWRHKVFRSDWEGLPLVTGLHGGSRWWRLFYLSCLKMWVPFLQEDPEKELIVNKHKNAR